MARKLILFSLSIFGLLLSACGTIATPVYSQQAQGTETAAVATGAYLTSVAPTATATQALPTATPIPSTATPVPPTDTAVPPTATAVPPTAVPATAAPTAASAAQPVSGALGDPANGKVVFNTVFPQTGFACATCHYFDKEDRLIGPGLKGISQRAAQRVPGETNVQYIHQSIVDPSAYVVPDFPDNLMPKIWGTVLTPQQIDDLVAYLMTL